MKDGYYWCKVSKNSPWVIREIRGGYVIYPTKSGKDLMELLYKIGDFVDTPEKYRSDD